MSDHHQDVNLHVEGVAAAAYPTPKGTQALTHTTIDSLLSDDFGGTSIDTTKWDVIDGGLRVGTVIGGNTSTVNIGTGTTGITDSVASSALTVSMGTVSGAERWYLSKQVFAAKEDILVVLNKSQANANNSIFIGMVEVDPVTLIPLLNPNFANEFTNRGGCEFGLTATTTAFQAEAIGDSSSAKATGAVGVAGAATTTTQEYLIEVDARDIIVSSATVDSVAIKAAGASRVSSQCPNDTKLYKLVMRFKNVGVPTATNVVIQRVLVVNNYEQRVQVSTGEGDNIGAKSLGVNVTNPASTLTVVSNLNPTTGLGPSTFKDVQAAATTNATSVKATAAVLSGGYIFSRRASACFLKFYNKTAAPTVGTDVPILQICVPANGQVYIGNIVGAYGMRFSSGLAYAITGAYGTADTTAVAAADIDVELIYT